MRQHGPWQIRSTREVHRDPWIQVTVDDVIRPDGKPGTFSVVRVKPGVAVLALDHEGNVHLTEEFRYALGRRSLEVVGGACEADEDPLDAARRELKEELGIEASEWSDLGSLDPVTSMILSPVRLFLAGGRLALGKPEREGTEQIRTVTMSLAEALRAVLEGRITHAPSCVLILKVSLERQQSGVT